MLNKAGNDIQRIFRIYSFYTVLLAALFMGFYLFDGDNNWWQTRSTKLLPVMLTAYCFLAAANLLVSYTQNLNNPKNITPYFLIDILIIGVLLLFVAPSHDEFGLMMLISVSVASIILPRQLGLLCTAIASIILLSTSLASANYDKLFQNGVLASVYFFTNFLLYFFQKRLQSAQSNVAQTVGQLRQIEKLNEMIIQRMQTGIVVCNGWGKILLINRAAQEKIGIFATGQTLPEQVIERLKEWLGSNRQNPNPMPSVNGSTSILLSFAIIDDKTNLMFIEDSDVYNQKAQNLKLASMGRFAASIAHEIRNPLSAINHASQLLDEAEYLQPADKRLCDIISQQITRVELIVQNVLQIAKRQPSQTQSFDLKNWLYTFQGDFLTRYPKVNIQISGLDMNVNFDPSQLHQVLWNLAENSQRYGKNQQGECNIELLCDRDEYSDRPCLIISDNGQGIADDKRNFLFEPFFTTSVDGTGLGLYIAQELAQANQGELRYYDNKKPGACFRLIFPYSPAN